MKKLQTSMLYYSSLLAVLKKKKEIKLTLNLNGIVFLSYCYLVSHNWVLCAIDPACQIGLVGMPGIAFIQWLEWICRGN